MGQRTLLCGGQKQFNIWQKRFREVLLHDKRLRVSRKEQAFVNKFDTILRMVLRQTWHYMRKGTHHVAQACFVLWCFFVEQKPGHLAHFGSRNGILDVATNARSAVSFF